jgi:hypothetical protein
MSALSQIEEDTATWRMLYISGLLLVFVPFFLTLSQIWPLQLANIQWRFTVANIMSSILVLPFIGMVLLLVLARVEGSRKVALTIAVVSAVFTVALLVSLVLFVLDALQIKAIIQSSQLEMWKLQFVRVLVVTTTFAISFGMLALASLKTPRGAVSTTRKSTIKADEGGDLIVGRV